MSEQDNQAEDTRSYCSLLPIGSNIKQATQSNLDNSPSTLLSCTINTSINIVKPPPQGGTGSYKQTYNTMGMSKLHPQEVCCKSFTSSIPSHLTISLFIIIFKNCAWLHTNGDILSYAQHSCLLRQKVFFSTSLVITYIQPIHFLL